MNSKYLQVFKPYVFFQRKCWIDGKSLMEELELRIGLGKNRLNCKKK